MFFTHINRLTLHQDNGKDLSTKEAIVKSQDCPKLLGSSVTCCSERVKKETLLEVFYCEFCKIFKNTFYTEHLWGTDSIYHKISSNPIS